MKKTFLKRKPASLDMTLQITSMADIFMILLVFLLKSFSTSLSNIAPNKDTKLPVVAVTAEPAKESLKLEISRDSILIDQRPIVRLDNYAFRAGESPNVATAGALYQTLIEERKHLPEPNLEPNLLIMADERTPYGTLKGVLASAAHAGFVDLQLVVIQDQ